MSLKNKLFGFDGRLRRRDWWLLGIAVGAAHNLLHYVSVRVLGLDDHVLIGGVMPVIGDPWPQLLLAVSFSLVFAWPQLALTVKRAHDINRRAWSFVLISVGIQALGYWPRVNYAIPGPTIRQTDFWSRAEPWIIDGGTLVGLLYLVVVLGFLDGTQGPNRFGRSPKGIGGDPADKAAEVFS